MGLYQAMMDRDNITRTGAKDPWGTGARPLEQRHMDERETWTPSQGVLPGPKCAKDGGKLNGCEGMSGAGLTETLFRQALSDILALNRTEEKLTVRDFRGDDGNVGIIRSPVRAMVLPDRYRKH